MFRIDLGQVVLFTVLLASLPDGRLPGQEAAAVPREVSVLDCRVKLIDQITLASDRNGIVNLLGAREGDRVVARQKVAVLDDNLIAAELAAAEHRATNDIEVRANEKAAELAATEYEKARQANRSLANTVPFIEIQRLKLAAEKSILEVDLAQHDLIFYRLQRDVKKQELATFAVTTPLAGLVTKVFKHPGEAVRQGDPILEITNTDRVRVEGWVELEHAWEVVVGQRVLVNLEIPETDAVVEERRFEGRISFVDVTVQPVTRQTKIFADVINQENILRAGLTANMVVRLDQSSPPEGQESGTQTTLKPVVPSPNPFRRSDRTRHSTP